MAEYIDREAFKKEYLCFGYLPEMSETEFDAFPSADVAPVRHGRWEFRCILGEDPYRCSVCGNSVDVLGYDYCPNCGAKMDGKEGEQE